MVVRPLPTRRASVASSARSVARAVTLPMAWPDMGVLAARGGHGPQARQQQRGGLAAAAGRLPMVGGGGT